MYVCMCVWVYERMAVSQQKHTTKNEQQKQTKQYTPIHPYTYTTTTHIGYYTQRSSSLGFIQQKHTTTIIPPYTHTHILPSTIHTYTYTHIHTHINHAYRLQNTEVFVAWVHPTITHNKNTQHTINNKNTQQPIYIHTSIHPYTFKYTSTTHIGYKIQRSSSLGFIQQ